VLHELTSKYPTHVQQLGDLGIRAALQLVSHDNIDALRATYTRCTLTTPGIWPVQPRQTLSHLTLLALDGNCLITAGATTIADVIAQDHVSMLSVLSLNHCAIDDEGMVNVVTSATAHLPQLVYIGLGYNGISDAGCEHQAMTHLLTRSTCVSLHTVHLAGNPLITNVGARRLLHSILSASSTSELETTTTSDRIDTTSTPENETHLDQDKSQSGQTTSHSAVTKQPTPKPGTESAAPASTLAPNERANVETGDVGMRLPLVTVHDCDPDLDATLREALLSPHECDLDVRECPFGCGEVSGVTRLEHCMHEVSDALRLLYA
jgi:hypothetical protein